MILHHSDFQISTCGTRCTCVHYFKELRFPDAMKVRFYMDVGDVQSRRCTMGTMIFLSQLFRAVSLLTANGGGIYSSIWKTR